jgi:hypothetical protein
MSTGLKLMTVIRFSLRVIIWLWIQTRCQKDWRKWRITASHTGTEPAKRRQKNTLTTICGGAMTIMQALDNMLGFIVKQPLHVTLRQMRIVPVGLIVSSQLLLWEVVRSLRVSDPTQAAMAYSALGLALITSIWQGLKHITDKAEKDD